MGEIDLSSLANLDRDLKRLTEEFRAARREMMDDWGKGALEGVRSHIGGQGKVQGWQSAVTGSGGGYAAVRPKANLFLVTKSGKRYAVGYVTNAIEHGHMVRGPSGKRKRYRPRLHKTQVAGQGYYSAAGAEAEALAETAAQQLADRLAGIVDEGE